MCVFPTALPALAKSCEVFVFWRSYPKEPLQIEQYVSSCQACSCRAEGEQSRLCGHFRPGAVPASGIVAKSPPGSEVTSPHRGGAGCPSLGVLPPTRVSLSGRSSVPAGLLRTLGRGGEGVRCGVCRVPGGGDRVPPPRRLPCRPPRAAPNPGRLCFRSHPKDAA